MLATELATKFCDPPPPTGGNGTTKWSQRAKEEPKSHLVSPGDFLEGMGVETGVPFGREGASASKRETPAV